VRIRDGPATVIVEGWSTKPLIPAAGDWEGGQPDEARVRRPARSRM